MIYRWGKRYKDVKYFVLNHITYRFQSRSLMQNNGIPIAKKGKVESSLCIHRAFHPWMLTPLVVGCLRLWILICRFDQPRLEYFYSSGRRHYLLSPFLMASLLYVLSICIVVEKLHWFLSALKVLPAEPFPTKGKQIDEINEGWFPITWLTRGGCWSAALAQPC